jgi:hypothetical protein
MKVKSNLKFWVNGKGTKAEQKEVSIYGWYWIEMEYACFECYLQAGC